MINLRTYDNVIIGDGNVTSTSGLLVEGSVGVLQLRIQSEDLFAVTTGASVGLIGTLAYTA